MPETSVTNVSKSPPVESKESRVTRNWVVLSFWAVVVLLGFPTWLWTTSIHRASLPIAEMLEWADGRACKPVFPLQVVLDAPSLSEHDSTSFLRLLQHTLDDNNEFPMHHLRLMSKQTFSGSEPPALTIHMVPGQQSETRLRPRSTILDVSYTAGQTPTITTAGNAFVDALAVKLQEIFLEEQAGIAHLMSTGTDAASIYREQAKGAAKVLTSELITKLEKRQQRSMKYSPAYHITISLITPKENPSSWDIESAVQEYLSPLVSSFNMSTFTIDTQVQLFAGFSGLFSWPGFDQDKKVWTLGPGSLSGFINAAEWPLSPSIGPGLTLNFILYIPDPVSTPLVVEGTYANSWIIPQWGGIYILNQPTVPGVRPQTPEHLTLDHLKPAFLTFSKQLLALLGAPESPAGSLDLQIQSLTRYRAASLLLSASSTLGSMARLTSKLSQIPIPENVARAVDSTLQDLRQSCDFLRSGDFQHALERARNADILAEEAFFEKSMVGQVYFPDEHKVAVYLPLLAPISVPLLTSGIRVLKESLLSSRNRGL